MATRSCPECGAQYVASVRRCIDCDVVLVDEVSPGGAPEAAAVAEPVGEGDRVSYLLEGWGNQLKVSLEGMLDQAGILRVWEVGALVVSADDVDEVEALIATVEGRDVDDLADLDEQLAFEIEGLDTEGAAELDAQLIAAGIVHAWSEQGDLLVALDDEERVTAIVEAVVEGDIDDDDGLAANQVLSDLFVALDRLLRSPHDHKLARRFAAAAGALAPMGVPYGFAAQEWAELKDEVAGVVALAEGTSDEAPDESTDEDAEGAPDETPDDTGDAEAEPVTTTDPAADDDDPTGDDRLDVAGGALRERLLAWV